MTRRTLRSLQAVVFDFDGVLANTEPLHLRIFQETLGQRGLTLTSPDYYERNLGYDDGDVFRTVARDQQLTWNEDEIAGLVRDKSSRFRRRAAGRPILFPRVADRVREWAASVPVAIASGAFRDEIETILTAAGVRELFPVIVGAGETPSGKPAPDPYLAALEQLRERLSARGESCGAAPKATMRSSGGHPPEAARSVAVEDSVWGIEAAHRAGMKVVAVTTSYAHERLTAADAVVASFEDLSLELFDELAGR
jgi:beta-phosphoglucomutase